MHQQPFFFFCSPTRWAMTSPQVSLSSSWTISLRRTRGHLLARSQMVEAKHRAPWFWSEMVSDARFLTMSSINVCLNISQAAASWDICTIYALVYESRMDALWKWLHVDERRHAGKYFFQINCDSTLSQGTISELIHWENLSQLLATLWSFNYSLFMCVCMHSQLSRQLWLRLTTRGENTSGSRRVSNRKHHPLSSGFELCSN